MDKAAMIDIAHKSVFYQDIGLIQRYEDFFDPSWMTRHPAAAAA